MWFDGAARPCRFRAAVGATTTHGRPADAEVGRVAPPLISMVRLMRNHGDPWPSAESRPQADVSSGPSGEDGWWRDCGPTGLEN
ncbi:hypothetical protein DIZ27_39815 [Streptomyces sp. NWU339]|nr:hypothetical protein DIZ27_39815 [Streptomyces sp. NWU339]